TFSIFRAGLGGQPKCIVEKCGEEEGQALDRRDGSPVSLFARPRRRTIPSRQLALRFTAPLPSNWIIYPDRLSETRPPGALFRHFRQKSLLFAPSRRSPPLWAAPRLRIITDE